MLLKRPSFALGLATFSVCSFFGLSPSNVLKFLGKADEVYTTYLLMLIFSP